MSGAGEIFRLDLRRRLRDPVAAVTWLALPVLMVALLAAAFGPGRPPRAVVALVDRDGGLGARLLAAGLGNERLRDLIELRTEDTGKLDRAMRRGELSAVLEVPAGFTDRLLDGKPSTLVLRTNPQQEILPRLATGVVETLAEGLGLLRRAVDPVLEHLRPPGGTGEPTLEDSLAVGTLMYDLFQRPETRALLQLDTVEVSVATARPRYSRTDVVGWFAPGFLIMGLLFLANGLTESVHAEMRAGILARLLTLPVRPTAVAEAKLAAIAAYATACGLVMALAFAGLVGWRPAHPLHLVLAVAASAAALAALGLALRCLARNPEGAGAASTGVMVGLAFLGGCFVPSQLLPRALARAAEVVPPGWAVTAARLAQEGGAPGPAFWWRIAALAGCAALVGAASARLLVRRVRLP